MLNCENLLKCAIIKRPFLRIGEKEGGYQQYDDEMNIRKVIREYAEFNDFLVDEAADGEQAVEMAYNNDYDIIVMDIMMPKLDGYSACREIRKSKNTPVIFSALNWASMIML